MSITKLTSHWSNYIIKLYNFLKWSDESVNLPLKKLLKSYPLCIVRRPSFPWKGKSVKSFPKNIQRKMKEKWNMYTRKEKKPQKWVQKQRVIICLCNKLITMRSAWKNRIWSRFNEPNSLVFHFLMNRMNK